MIDVFVADVYYKAGPGKATATSMLPALQPRSYREAVKRQFEWENARKDPDGVLKIMGAVNGTYVHHAEMEE